jgi:hypothetical protein
MTSFINTMISGITSFWKKPTPVLHPVPPVATLMDLSIAALVKRYETIGQPNQPAPSLREWESVTWFTNETGSVAQKIQGIENGVLQAKPDGVTPERFFQVKVTKMFQALKEAYPIPLTDLAQVSAWEDDALQKIYDALGEKYPAQFPRLKSVSEIKTFLDDPKNLPAIQTVTDIFVSDKKLKAIPPQLLKFSNLRCLTLMSGEISFIPEWIGNMRSLASLTLSGNRIQKIPDSLGNLNNLFSLDLMHNQIDAIPDSLGKLTALSSFNMNFNQIRTIPATLSKLTKLTNFSLHYNQIEEFPAWISSLPAYSPTSTDAAWLGLTHNKIRELPATIPNREYVFISLDYNNITEVPDGIKNSHHISLEGNPIIGSDLSVYNFVNGT